MSYNARNEMFYKIQINLYFAGQVEPESDGKASPPLAPHTVHSGLTFDKKKLELLEAFIWGGVCASSLKFTLSSSQFSQKIYQNSLHQTEKKTYTV